MKISKLLLFLAISSVGLSQQTTHNPFSAYGMGEENYSEQAASMGLGQTGISYFDSTFLNVNNPSSYTLLGTGQPVFSTGLNGHLAFYQQGGQRLFRGLGQIDHFALGFKLKKHFGLTFGLKSFAKRGYNIQEVNMAGTDSLEYTYLGKGGFQNAFIGFASNLLKTKVTTLAIGTNVGYLFGTSTNERQSRLISGSNVAGGIDYNTLRLSSLYFETGFFLRQLIGKHHQLVIAGTFEPKQQLSATKDEFLFFGIVGNPNSYDTLYSSERITGKVTSPTRLGLGGSYTFWFNDLRKNNTARNSELSLHVNYSRSTWSEFTTTFSNNDPLLDCSRINIGVQYIPERKFLENAVSSKFMERIRYKAGYFSGDLPYSFGGVQMKEHGVTLGIGMPIISQNSLSSLQFGITLGERSTGVIQAFKEQYIALQFGVCIAPGIYERWFRKRKLD